MRFLICWNAEQILWKQDMRDFKNQSLKIHISNTQYYYLKNKSKLSRKISYIQEPVTPILEESSETKTLHVTSDLIPHQSMSIKLIHRSLNYKKYLQKLAISFKSSTNISKAHVNCQENDISKPNCQIILKLFTSNFHPIINH